MALPEYSDKNGRAGFNQYMRNSRASLIVCLALSALALCPRVAPGQIPAGAQIGSTRAVRERQEQFFALTNQARARAGVRPVKWDSELAAAALNHCLRMAAEGQIAHRYGGEPNVTERAAQAGAHFSMIAENVAVGSYVSTIQQGWLDSPGHRANMLNPDVDRVGIAVVASGGVIYAVADFSRDVPVFSPRQAEDAIAQLLRASGMEVLSDRNGARATCATEHGLPRTVSGPEPRFVMRWQDADLGHLPRPLVSKINSGDYRRAAVGSCPAQDVGGSFTVYRMAVLLYGPPTTNELKPFY